MPVELIGLIATQDASETRRSDGPLIDREYVKRFALAHEASDFDRVLIGYSSASPDNLQVAAYAAAHTERLGYLVAHRPGVTFPTVAARAFATLDQFAQGRIALHTITGGFDAEQRRDGDYLSKEDRYARTREYLQILKRAWTEDEPFSHQGRFYQFADYVTHVKPFQEPRIPIYFGGSSDEAYAVGAAEADVYALFAQPLASDRRGDRAHQGRGGRRRPRGAAAHQRLLPPDPGRDRGRGVGARAPHPRHDQGQRRRADQGLARLRRRAGVGGLAAPARRRRARRAPRPRAVDVAGRGDRRARQLDRARRHRRDRRRGAAGLRRPRRQHAADPRL